MEAVIGSYQVDDIRLLARRNRIWRPIRVVVSLGGIAPPDPTQLRQSIHTALSNGTGGELLRLFDGHTGTSGRPAAGELERFSAALVSAEPGTRRTELRQHTLRLYHDKLAELPFRLTIGADWMGIAVHHALVDGRNLMALLTAILRDGKIPQDPAGKRPSRYPLCEALLHTYGRHPSLIWRVLRQPRVPWPIPPADQAVMSDDRPVALVTGCSEPDFLPAMRAYRDATTPGCSVLALLISRTISTVQETGNALAEGFSITVDARRYLPRGATASGNFSAGSFLACGSRPNPVQVSQTIGALLRNGRPLLSMLLSCRRADKVTTGWDIDPLARKVLSFSHLGRYTIPVPDGTVQSDLDMCMMSLPLGPYGISMSLIEIGGRLQVTAAYFPELVPSELVQEMVNSLTSTPVDRSRRGTR